MNRAASIPLTAAPVVKALWLLSQNPERAVSARAVACRLDCDEAAAELCLQALVARGLAQREPVFTGPCHSESGLYRLSSVPVVWNLARAHRDLAA